LYQITAATRTPDWGATAHRSPFSVLCPQLNLFNPLPPETPLSRGLVGSIIHEDLDMPVACFLPVRSKDLSAPPVYTQSMCNIRILEHVQMCTRTGGGFTHCVHGLATGRSSLYRRRCTVSQLLSVTSNIKLLFRPDIISVMNVVRCVSEVAADRAVSAGVDRSLRVCAVLQPTL
jgi:hypothetical protein